MRIVDSVESLAAAVAHIRKASPDGVFLQQFIRGRRCIVGTFCIDGTVHQLISHRVLDTFPHATSPSIVNRSFHSGRLTEMAETVFRLLHWTGFGSADFIEDEHGEFYFLEMNPRLWGSAQVAEVCGVPMLNAFARLLNGREQQPRALARPDRTVMLYPQYLFARLAQGRLWRIREAGPVLRCLIDGPPGVVRYLGKYLRRRAVRLWTGVVNRRPADSSRALADEKTAVG